MGQCASDHQGVIMDTNCPLHLQPDPSTAIWVNVQATTRAWSGILTAPPSTTRSFHRYMGQCASDHQGVIMDTNCPPPPPHLQPDPSTAIWVNVQATTRAWSWILTAPPSTTRSFHRYIGQCASDHQDVIKTCSAPPPPSTTRSFHRYWVNVQATTRAWSWDANCPPPSTTRSFHRYMGQCASDHQGVIRDTNCPPIYNQILPPLYGSMCKRPQGRDQGC